MDMTNLIEIREAVMPEEDDDYDLKEPVDHLVSPQSVHMSCRKGAIEEGVGWTSSYEWVSGEDLGVFRRLLAQS